MNNGETTPLVAVMGLGFVGLSTALCLTERSCRVCGYDLDSARREQIGAGEIPFHEPGLSEAMSRHLGKGFVVAGSLDAALAGADFVFVCVGTPAGPDGGADLTILLHAVAEAAGLLGTGNYPVVIVKSTVPPGTTAGPVRQALERAGRRIGVDIGLAVAPEFLREGNAWKDSLHPDRIVVGAVDPKSGERLKMLYKRFPAPLHVTTPNTAEFIKYASNTLLATLISFSNEQTMLAQRIGDIEIAEAFRILHQDRRWIGSPANMSTYAYPGCGFGGYCLPKDTAALLATARGKGLPGDLLAAVLSVNRQSMEDAVARIASAAGKTSATIGILGLSFKPGSDDVRETPAAAIIGGLLERGFSKIVAHDPMAMEAYAKAYMHPIAYHGDSREVIAEADVVALLTAWPEYGHLDFGNAGLVDCRYFLRTGRHSGK